MSSPDGPQRLASGLTWPEAPRWRDGFLWVSDVHNFRLARIGPDGAVETAASVDGRPSGMDFAAEGRLLLATGVGRQLLDVQVPSGAMQVAADLTALTRANLNDLVTRPDGWSWVGDTGFVFGQDEPRRAGRLVAYHPSFGPRVVAEDVFFPNGMAVTPDGGTLYLAETFGRCVTAFDIGENGALDDRRLHAELEGSPDGLCLDAEGCLWVALLFEGAFARVAPHGGTVARIEFPGKNAIACILGGKDRSTLFLCVSEIDRRAPAKSVRRGEISGAPAPAPGAGKP